MQRKDWPDAREAGEWWYANVPVVPLRRDPSDAAEQVSQLLCGERVRVVDWGEKDWLEVRCDWDGYSGWCDGKQLRPLGSWDEGEGAWGRLAQPVSTWWRKDGAGEVALRLSAGSRIWRGAEEGRLGGPTGTRVWPEGGDWEGWQLEKIANGANVEAALQQALRWLGVPYVWGGRSTSGVDCSGLIQVTAMGVGWRLPRDASQQWEASQPVAWEERRRGDLAFFSNASGQIIHVAWLLDAHTVLHAAGEVRRDLLDARGIIRRFPETPGATGQVGAAAETVTHTLAGIRRWAAPVDAARG